MKELIEEYLGFVFEIVLMLILVRGAVYVVDLTTKLNTFLN